MMILFIVQPTHLGSRRFHSSSDLPRAGRSHDLEKPSSRSKPALLKCNSLHRCRPSTCVLSLELWWHLNNQDWGDFPLCLMISAFLEISTVLLSCGRLCRAAAREASGSESTPTMYTANSIWDQSWIPNLCNRDLVSV